MKYHAGQTKMWDAWFLNVEGTVHCFHLQMPAEGCTLSYEQSWSIGHAVSTDLLHWTQCPDILPPLQNDRIPLDYSSKFTGCAYELDRKYYLFYTMRDKDWYSQRIGVAVSEDLYNWVIHDGNPVIVPDPDLLIGYGGHKAGWGIVDCRDLSVVHNPQDGLFYGYFAAAADVGRLSPVGVIAVAVSEDLIHWRDQRIAYVPPCNGVIEVPDVYHFNDRWVMTVLSGNNYCGRNASDDENLSNFTLYATADSPSGPFTGQPGDILIGGVSRSGFTCRTVEHDGKRYLFYVDRPHGIETLSLPKEIRPDDAGNPCACFADIVTKLRTATLIGPDRLPAIRELPQNSFAWKTYGGTFVAEGTGYAARMQERSWQAAGFGTGSASIEFNIDIRLSDAKAAGIWVASRGAGTARNYLFLLEKDLQRVCLTEFYTFECLAARKFTIGQDTVYRLKLLMLEGSCELYIGGRLVLQCGLEMHESNYAGIFCDSGRAEFGNISMYSLET
ncbi:MAG: glycoside hydrolase family protein [Saccharofermentanales bacterium]